MAEYRVFYFVGSRLEWCEAIDAPDHLTAINRLCGRATDQVVEIWDSDTKVAVLGTAKHSLGQGARRGGQAGKSRFR